MNDTLSYAETEFDYRGAFHNKTNFSMMYAYSEHYILPVSHDEVVHGKKSFLDRMPGDYWRKFAGSRLFLSYMMFHPGKKLTFMGVEIGQFREWDYEGSIEWFLLGYDMHKQHQSFVRDLNRFYLAHPQLWHNDHDWDGFRWLRPDDYINSVSSFMRINPAGDAYKELVVVLNYNYPARDGFVIDVPYSGVYREIFNSDKCEYGGSGFINEKPLESFKGENGNDLLSIHLPPLGVSVFELQKLDSERKAGTKLKAALAEKEKREKAQERKERAEKTAKKPAAAKKDEKTAPKKGNTKK